MGERPTPTLVIPRDQIEILPADPSDQRPVIGGSRIWVSFDAKGGNRRVFIARPGPIGTILLSIALGMLLAVTFVVVLGVVAVLACITGVLMVGILLNGLIRGQYRRLR
jgi:hypothetical protein